MKIKMGQVIKLIALCTITAGAFFVAADALAQAAGAGGGTSGNLGTIANNVRSNLSALAKLITAASYVIGFGFAFASIMKFKAHKDNPQQVPIGTPVALLFVAAALIFLPSVFSVSGKTVFGGSGTAGSVSGSTSIPGAGAGK